MDDAKIYRLVEDLRDATDKKLSHATEALLQLDGDASEYKTHELLNHIVQAQEQRLNVEINYHNLKHSFAIRELEREINGARRDQARAEATFAAGKAAAGHLGFARELAREFAKEIYKVVRRKR